MLRPDHNLFLDLPSSLRKFDTCDQRSFAISGSGWNQATSNPIYKPTATTLHQDVNGKVSGGSEDIEQTAHSISDESGGVDWTRWA